MLEKLNEKDISSTFIKGLAVLSAFDAQDPEMTIPMIARKTALNRTVARRLVLTLEYLGYLEQTSRIYRLTPRVLSLASGFLQGRDLGKHVTPILKSYSDQIRESVSFAMLDGDQAIYVAHSPGDPTLITQGFTVGTRLPLLATAIGRALLAFLPEGRRETLLAQVPRVAYTPETRMDTAALREVLRITLERGYALVRNEFEVGVTSLAVPVLRAGTEVVGALGIAGPNPRLDDPAAQQQRLDKLRDCAATIALLA
ncbi:MAG TPA: IclR family transcriptional regulator C-terminal domain-containing protein [Thiolinea sp.]|nr:IclR family transcriptional regulator C-terminal domain-containing protein [Thiolinea sp.]